MGLLGRLFGAKHTRAELAALLKEREQALEALPVRYQVFRIPKRGGGERTLHAPEKALKRLQRSLLRTVLAKPSPHPSATGFRPGMSIVEHGRRHAGKAVVVKLDLADFFPSVKAGRVDAFFKARGWDAGARVWLLRWTTWEDSLPQGAPTSPALSNLVNLRLDHRLDALARHFGGTYSRYADDLTFSFDKADVPLDALVHTARDILTEEGYRIQERKRIRVLRAHRRQRVLGLVVNNPKPALPRETRRWLRAVRHRIKTGKQATLTPEQLRGWEAFSAMVAAP